MKLRVNQALRRALLACMASCVYFSTGSTAWGGESYMAEGVHAQNLTASERFYDNGKGHYWTWLNYTPFMGAYSLYESTGSYAFLGDLASRVNTISGISDSTFSRLTNDANTCWYNVASNVLQYWQSYYGVFAKDIVYGYTYNKDYADDLGGTQSLKLGMYFYDNWTNDGGNLFMAANWYLAGDDSYYNYPYAASLKYKGKGGFFAEYFGEESATVYSYAEDIHPSSFADELASHMGMEKQKDGSYKLIRKGQLVDLSIVHEYSGGAQAGHALTCYGFTVSDSGMIESVQVTNSDDQSFKLITLYVKYVDGAYHLYEDKACTKQWLYSKLTWQVSSISSIRTPDILLQMYDSYTDADNPLVWSGSQQSWCTIENGKTVDAMPNASTGWVVKVGNEYYASYIEDGRKVRFDDHAANAVVKVREQVSTASMELGNSSLSYSFIGSGTTAAIRADKLVTTGSGSALFQNVAVSGASLQLSHYTLELGKGCSMTYTTAGVDSGSVLKFNGGTAAFSTLTLGAYSSLQVAADASLSADVCQSVSSVIFQFSAPGALLTFDGLLDAAAPIRIDYTGSAVEDSSYALIHFEDGLSDWADVFYTGYGTLSYANNTLYLAYKAIEEKIHGEDFTGLDSTLDHTEIVLDGRASGLMSVEGKVSLYALNVTDGSYVWKNGINPGQLDVLNRIVISGDAVVESRLATLEGNQLVLSDTAQLILNADTESNISRLSAAPGTSTRVASGDVTFENTTSLGKLLVDAGAEAVFCNAQNLDIEGQVTANGSLTFLNGAESGLVTYTLGQSGNVLNAVTIGAAAVASPIRVSLAVPGDVTGSFTIKGDGELVLLGNGVFSATASGFGVLTVARDAVMEMTVNQLKTTFDSSLNLNVKGDATVGADNALLAGKVCSSATVSGSLLLNGAMKEVSLDALTMEGGTFAIDNYYYDGLPYASFRRSIGQLTVAEQGGTLISRLCDGYAQFHSITDIGSLSGTGNLTIQGESFICMHLYRVASLGEDGYSGKITLLHNSMSWTSGYSYDQATILELGSMQMEGSVYLKTLYPCTNPTANSCFITALGIDGDVTLGGLDSTEAPVTRVYLYSGNMRDSNDPLTHGQAFSSLITKEEHTLTLDADDNHRFSGSVCGSLNLVKKGSGEQAFLGDMSAFDGSVDVQGGTLMIQESFSAKSVRVNQSTLHSDGTVNSGSLLTMTDGALEAQALVCTNGAFAGHNTIEADSVSGTVWTLALTKEHLEQAIVTINGSLSLSEIVLNYDSSQMYVADYALLRCSGDVSLATELSNARWETEMIDGIQYKTLWFSLTDGGLLLPRTTPATLTWTAPSGVWAVEQGHSANTWVASVANRNFYDGDTVIFSQAATVSLSGEVKPATITINHTSGQLVFEGSGSISGNSRLTKSGAGELIIQTANTYSGGTTINEGSVTLNHASALGLGSVLMNGGSLNLNNLAVANQIVVSGDAILSNGAQYQGSLVLESGSLAGSVHLSKVARLRSGTVNATLSGTGGVQVSGSVNLTAENHYTGGTELKSGHLTISHNKALGTGDISSSGTSELTVSTGCTLVLSHAISNSGTLTMSGAYDVSAFATTALAPVHINTTGVSGKSGFQASGGYSVQVVSGGRTKAEGATIVWKGEGLTLGSNGVAVRASDTDYSHYLLAVGDATGVADINGMAEKNGCFVTSITTDGGVLKLDADVTGDLTLDGGEIEVVETGIVVNGQLDLKSLTSISLSGTYDDGETYTLILADSISGDCSGWSIMDTHPRQSYTLYVDEIHSALMMEVVGDVVTLTWANDKKATWQEGAGGWGTSDVFCTGDHVLFHDGTATIVGDVAPGEVIIQTAKSFTFKVNKKAPGRIVGEDSSVLISATSDKAKVTMTDDNTYGGGTIINSGTVNATGASSFGLGEIVLKGGTLNLAGKGISNDITLQGVADIKAGKNYTGSFTMSGGELMKGSLLNIVSSATLSGGKVSGTLSGIGSVMVDGEVALEATAKLTTNKLEITENGILSASSKGLAMNAKTSAITIEGGALNTSGKVAAYSLRMDDVATVTAGQMSMKDNIQLKESSTLNVAGKLDAFSIKLTDSKLNANGNVSLKGHLELSNSHVKLWDASPKNKAVSLSVKGDVNMFTKDNPLTPDVETLATSLTLSGALSATNLTLNGAILNLTGSKLQTVKVKNCLTLSGTNIINLAFNVTEKDVDKGKTFKLFTFKSINMSTSDLHALLGLDASYCSLALDKKKTSILLTVTDYDAWVDYITPDLTEPLLTTCAVAEETEPVAEESATTLPMVTAPAVDVALAKVSDTLVQTTWGAAKASRAFVGSIESRGQNAAALAGGRGAAWGAALGSSSRLSSHGGGQGADYNMSGAAVGAEISATELHNIGVAMGCTWGKVSTFSAYAADQDTTHVALYGSSRLKQTANGGLTLVWSAAYGRSENDADLVGADYDWTQHSVQMDARLSYARTLNERTVVRAFGGLQYLHVDAATPTAGAKADSMENLRVELGVGATWMATAMTALNGEVSFIGDMLRDNPAAVVGGSCRGGANPGRAGVNVGVGATHQLNESWSVNAGYNLELVPRATSHNASVGATYRF